MALHRFSTHILSVSVDNSSITDSQEILYGEYTCGEVQIPAGSSITSLAWWVAPKAGGTYLPARDYNGVLVTQTVAHSNAYPIPLALIGNVVLKALANAAGTIDVSLKA